MVETNEGCASVVPIASSQLLLDSQSTPRGRDQHLFASFREFVKTSDFCCVRYCRGRGDVYRSETFCEEACRGT
jgi:hypothetical protein